MHGYLLLGQESKPTHPQCLIDTYTCPQGMCIAIMVAVDASEKEALASGTQKCRPITIIISQLYTWGFPLKLNAMSLSSYLHTACSGQ